jgi:hypothetical protein
MAFRSAFFQEVAARLSLAAWFKGVSMGSGESLTALGCGKAVNSH